MTKAILFDIDGVLIDSFEANFEFYNRLFTKFGYTPPTKEQFKKQFFQQTMLGVIQAVTHLADTEKINKIMEVGKQRASIYPYELIKTPSSLSTVIASLHTTYRLGLVTSKIKNGIFEIPQLAPLQNFFSVVVAFEDTEKHKPDPEPLLFALNKLNLSPAETIYVGDQLSDFLAARAAGTRIVMYTNEPFPDADIRITSFDAIPDAISKIA